MTPIINLEEATEQHRRVIGWWSLSAGIIGFVIVTLMLTMMEHNNAQQERMVAYEKQKLTNEMMHINARVSRRLTRTEDAIRDMVEVSQRPIVLYYCGEKAPWDGHVVYWPPAAERLLGWTWEDVQKEGLACMIPLEMRKAHVTQMEVFVDVPLENRKTSIINTEALHKNGSRVPVQMSVWVVGEASRSVAATIDLRENIIER